MKRPSISTILFGILLILLIIPQTRIKIMVAVNKVKVHLFSPSVAESENIKTIAPFNYALKSIEGAPIDLEIGKEKIAFISYWATWCPPCIAEMPSIQKLYADYGDKIEFILITKEKTGIVKDFLNDKEYNLPVYIPEMKAPEELFSRSIPTSFLIDGKGNIIIRETGAADWNSKRVRDVLEDLLQKV